MPKPSWLAVRNGSSQILGLDIGQRVKRAGSFTPRHPNRSALVRGCPAPFDAAMAEVELDPEGYLIRLDVHVPDPQREQMLRLGDALAALLGAPQSLVAPRDLRGGLG